MMSIEHGWLQTKLRHKLSPHHDERPPGETPRLLVIHGISLPPGEFGGQWIEDLFCGTLDCSAHPSFASLENMRVSAHCLIRRDGEIIQFVPFDKRAWHAGKSCYMGKENCNDFSIGIELEGTDTLPYTDIQYQQLVNITHLLIGRYPELKLNITGHHIIAAGRKTDPGEAFDWPRYHSMLSADK